MSLLRRPCPQKTTETQQGPKVPKASWGGGRETGVCHPGAPKVTEHEEIRLEQPDGMRWLNGKASASGLPGLASPRTSRSLEVHSHPRWRTSLLWGWGKAIFLSVNKVHFKGPVWSVDKAPLEAREKFSHPRSTTVSVPVHRAATVLMTVTFQLPGSNKHNRR